MDNDYVTIDYKPSLKDHEDAKTLSNLIIAESIKLRGGKLDRDFIVFMITFFRSSIGDYFGINWDSVIAIELDKKYKYGE